MGSRGQLCRVMPKRGQYQNATGVSGSSALLVEDAQEHEFFLMIVLISMEQRKAVLQDLQRVRAIPVNQNAEHLNNERRGSVECFFHCLSFLLRFPSATLDFGNLRQSEGLSGTLRDTMIGSKQGLGLFSPNPEALFSPNPEALFSPNPEALFSPNPEA